MRLLIISQYFWPENFRINDLAAELVKRGHKVTVLTGIPNYPDGIFFGGFLDNPFQYANYHGVDIVRVPILPRGKNLVSLGLNYISFAISASTLGLWKLRSLSFDAIFTCQLSPATVGIPAVVLRSVKKIPMIFWILDLWPESLSAVGVIYSKLIIRIVGRLISWIYQRTDLILVQSKEFIPAIAKYNTKRTRVKYFPSWSDLNFSVMSTDYASEVSVDSSYFTIVFTGNIGEAQDFPAILDAAEILKNFGRIRWLIIGDGRMSDWLAREIKARNLQHCFLQLGGFPIERMPSFIKHADALLVALKSEYIFSLTIPGKIQAYLAAGKPIIAMINGEGARVVKESGAGIVTPAGDGKSLAESVKKLLLMTDEERGKMGVNGSLYSLQEFDRAKLMIKLEETIEELIKAAALNKTLHVRC